MHVFSKIPQAETRGYSGGHRSPGAMGAAVAVHVAVAAAILVMPGVKILTRDPGTLITYAVPPDKTPPEASRDEKRKVDGKKAATAMDSVVNRVNINDGTAPVLPQGGDLTATGPEDFGVKPIDPPPPVIVAPSFDPARMRDLQPAYPSQMIRAQMEGSVTVHVLIGADGRVQAIDLVSADNSAFWEATRKQALKYWRFRPATRDGVPVAGEKTLTVHFRLSDL